MTGNWFDVILLLGIIGISIRGYLRGAVGFLISVGGGILSAVVSSIVGKNLAPWIYENFVRRSIEEKVTQTIIEVFQSGLENIGDSIFNTMPSFIWRFTDYYDVVYALDSVTGSSVEEISYSASEIIHSIAEPIYNSIISTIVTAILFIIFNIAVAVICKVTGVFNKIPIFGNVNRLLGIFLGMLYGCFLAWVLTCVIAIVSPIFDKNEVFQEKVESTSFVFSVVNRNMEKLHLFGGDTDEEEDYSENYDYYGDDYNYDYDYNYGYVDDYSE